MVFNEGDPSWSSSSIAVLTGPRGGRFPTFNNEIWRGDSPETWGTGYSTFPGRRWSIEGSSEVERDTRSRENGDTALT